jgi:hypothetical protein
LVSRAHQSSRVKSRPARADDADAAGCVRLIGMFKRSTPDRSPLAIDSVPAATRRVRVAFVLVALALLARVALSAVSVGTNDALTFAEFGKDVRLFGLFGAYANNPYLNHPPLVALWAAAVVRMTGAPVLPYLVAFTIKADWAFAFVFRLPVIAADALACGLLYARWRGRLGRPRAAALAAAFAWAPGAFLVSAYHANTDPLYSALCLLAVWLLEERGAFVWGGLALGAAINVKIIPGLMIAPLLLTCRSRSDARRFIAGLALAALPYLPMVLADFPTFYHNVLSYAGFSEAWGFNFFLIHAGRVGALAGPSARWVAAYHAFGRVILVALVLGWAVLARLRPRWDRYEVAAVTGVIFMAFSPSFGIQYMVLPGLMLFAVRPRAAIAYAVASGAFLVWIYARTVVSWHVPLISIYTGLYFPETVLLFPSWVVLMAFLWNTVVRRAIGGAQREQTAANAAIEASAAIGAVRPDDQEAFANAEPRGPIAA